VNKTNRAGMTALHFAGMFGQTRTAAFLLRIGADKFAKDNQGRTPGRIAMDWYAHFVVVFSLFGSFLSATRVQRCGRMCAAH
jgi:hypothetical protein